MDEGRKWKRLARLEIKAFTKVWRWRGSFGKIGAEKLHVWTWEFYGGDSEMLLLPQGRDGFCFS